MADDSAYEYSDEGAACDDGATPLKDEAPSRWAKGSTSLSAIVVCKVTKWVADWLTRARIQRIRRCEGFELDVGRTERESDLIQDLELRPAARDKALSAAPLDLDIFVESSLQRQILIAQRIGHDYNMMSATLCPPFRHPQRPLWPSEWH